MGGGTLCLLCCHHNSDLKELDGCLFLSSVGGLALSCTSNLFITTYKGRHSLGSSGRSPQVVPRTLLLRRR